MNEEVNDKESADEFGPSSHEDVEGEKLAEVTQSCSKKKLKVPRRFFLEHDLDLAELFALTISCVVSVSVLFRRKDRAKNGASKRGGDAEEGKETLADKLNPVSLKTAHIACHACANRHLIREKI